MPRSLRAAVLLMAMTLLALALAAIVARASAGDALIRGVRVMPPDHLVVKLARPITDITPGNFRFTEASAPDVPMTIREVRITGEGRLTIAVSGTLDPAGSYLLEIRDPPATRAVKPSTWALMLTAIVSAALINNFVFTRYLGLCIFFGVSKKRDTALGMGITFTAVMVTTGMLSWLLYQFVMKPLQLKFLQVIVFIGVVAFMVQLLDTILKKIMPSLHERFGIYLVLITTNCIILAVPLLNAAADTGALESFSLAMGAGFGFALAMFLMSCARERMELARVPASFQGLPIAFALAGLFALAFMGFSGLSFFR